MTDFNQDDQITPPVVSPPESVSRKRLSSDELIALFLAFTGIGGILFWTLTQKTSPIDLSSLTSDAPSFSNGKAANSGTSSEGTLFTGTPQPSASSSIALNGSRGNTIQDGSRAEVNANKVPDPVPSQPVAETSPDAKIASSTTVAAGVVAGTTSMKPSDSAVKGTLEAPVQAQPFTDVSNDFWAKDAIVALSSRGIINGFSDGTFKPNQPINRAEFASIVQKSFEKPKVKNVVKFGDIKDGFWAATAIDEATQSGFMNGYPGGVFKPEQAIPRLEMLSAIATGLKLTPQGDPTQTLAQYSDANTLPQWALPKVSSAIEAGITIPNSTILEPTKTATRADAAMFIYKALIKDGKLKP